MKTRQLLTVVLIGMMVSVVCAQPRIGGVDGSPAPYGRQDRHDERSALGLLRGYQLLCGPPGSHRPEVDGQFQCVPGG